MRLRLRGAFPEDRIAVFEGTEYSFRELANGYSSILVDADRQPMDGSRLDWCRSAALMSRTDTVVARSSVADVRIFTDGASAGVNGYIEARSFDPTRPFAIAAIGTATAHIRTWGLEAWSDYREEQLGGLRAGWLVITGSRAASDDLIRGHVPQLSFARRLRRIRLDGGLKIPGTQFYFRFAPPAVRVEGAREAAVVRFNDAEPVGRDATGACQIPQPLLTENAIRISCEDGEIQVQRTVFLRDYAGDGSAATDAATYTPFGARDASAGSPATPCGVPPAREPFVAVPLLPLEDDTHAVLIGASAGEVIPFDQSAIVPWQPVWAVIYRRRRASARFIGTSPVTPRAAKTAADSRALRSWRDILWHQRMRIAPPAFEPAKRLWLKYQEFARNG